MAAIVYRVPFSDPNAEPSASLQSGVPVFAVWDAAFAQDPLGDRGWLDYPFQETALIFEFDAATTPDSWVLIRNEETACDSGVGDTALETGFNGVQSETDTSLFPGGYESTVSYYTITDIGLRPSSVPYASALTGTAGSTTGTVERTGVTRNDCVGIQGLLAQSALEGSDVIFMQNGRTCEVLLGKPEFHPAGMALASQENVTNGAVSGCGIRMNLKRTFIIPPGTVTQIGYIFKIRHQTKISVAADPSFAAPTDNDICVLKLLWTFGGYFSDEDGLPLVQLPSASAGADYAEQKVAAKYAA